jgi:hypothetical protein
MAVPYHTHIFEIPTASEAEVIAGATDGKAVTPASLGNLATLAAVTPGATGLELLADATDVNARDTLGLGTAAVEDATAFATSTQGGKADTALQPAAIGSTVQAFDTDLTAVAALTSAANKVPYATGAGTWALADFSAAGRALVDDASAAAQLTTLGIPAEPAVRMVEFDIRMSQFAGGAPMNGIDDDGPALRAAADFSKTLGTWYNGGKAVFRLPRGVLRVDSVGPGGEGVDVTDCHGIAFIGAGRASTHIQSSINAPIIRGKNDPTVASLNYPEFREFTIRGPGYTNVNAHGLDIGSPFNGIIDVRIWGCRDALRITNAWQTSLRDIRIDGTGTARNYNGIVQLDGALSVVENAILVLGGQIQGCENYGWRGECVTGSKAFGLEIVGIGQIGVYIGDSPGGKPLKWFSWSGGLVDTCKRLILVKKGSFSTVAERIHFSGMWSSYASLGAGNGTNVEFNGLTECSFAGDMMPACDMAFYATDCVGVSMKAAVISGYDLSNIGQRAAIINNTTNSVFDFGAARKNVGSPSTRLFEETGTSANNDYYANGDGYPFMLANNRSTFHGHAGYNGLVKQWPTTLPTFTKAQLATMTATQYAGSAVICSDDVGGLTLAIFDGTAWRRMQDRNVIS